MPFRLAGLLLVASAALLGACRDDEEPAKAQPTGPEASSPSQALKPAAPERVNLLELLDSCDVSHRGHSIDVGSVAAETQRSFDQAFDKDVALIRHGGGSFAEVNSRQLDYDFWLTEARDTLHVSARVRGRRSGHLAAYIDGKRLGSARLSADAAKVVGFKFGGTELAVGRHRLSLRLSRGEPRAEGAYAEIEWIRLASPDDADDQYAAPTLKDIVSDVVLEKRPRRAIALREQSTVRCPIWPSADAHLKLWLGLWGNGHGRAEVRIFRQQAPAVTLEQRELSGGETAGWTPIDLPLGKYAGELIGVELGVRQLKGVGRVAFGDPMLVRTGAPASAAPRTNTAVLVVLSGLRRATLPPWGSSAQLPAFGELVRTGTAFTNYRVPSSVASAVLASALTGLPPREHTLEDQAARLPEGLSTVNRVLKQASGHTAMFTGVPTSFPAFGFSDSWDVHEVISPVSDEAAHAPLERAAAWLKADVERAPNARRLVLIHLRGAHPPWDVAKNEAAQLKPEEYNGAIDARRGAIALGNIRNRRQRASRRLDGDDWIRLRGLEAAALKKQDAAFAQLARSMEKLGIWQDSLVMVMGDVGAGEPPTIPYDPAGPLEESRLYVPLLVKFPGRRLAGKESGAAATSVDVATTLMESLGLEVPKTMQGIDLFQLASGRQPLAGRPMWATLGNGFATRLGHWRLSGELGKTPTLCDLAVDPACMNDVLEAKGFVGSSLWKWTFLSERASRERRSVSREPARIDPETSAALTVWGDLQ